MAEQNGFFGSLTNSMQSPLFLGGAGILMGGGFQGMNQGIQAGILGQKTQNDMKMQEAERIRQAQQDAENMRRFSIADGRAAAMHPLDLQAKRAAIASSGVSLNHAQAAEARAAELHPFKILDADASIENKRNGGEKPSNVREWQYFNALTPEQQQQYLTMKRSEKYLDTGTELIRPNPVDPSRPVSVTPKDVAGREFQQEVGTGAGKASVALPQIMSASRRMSASLDAVINDPNLGSVTGLVGGRIPKQLQTPAMAATQSRLEQIQGQTFLQAYNELRGAGAITESEGAKAEAAYSRLRTQTMGTDEYKAAAIELRNEIVNLTALAQQRARRPAGPSQPMPQQPLSPATPAAPAAGDWGIQLITPGGG